MYCIKCGVELCDGAEKCPLCKTRVFHPDFPLMEGEELYPKGKYPKKKRNLKVWQVLLTVAFVLPFIIVALCDLQYSRAITWSGFVMGALVLAYVSLILPLWFKKPNPVIFVPVSFFTAALYLLYINLVTDGDWFMTFAFPAVGAVGLTVTAVVTLMRYVPEGRFYIFGGASLMMGAVMLLLEFLMVLTFESVRFVGWSLYPMVTLILLGALLIFLGICRPARETMERKFFI